MEVRCFIVREEKLSGVRLIIEGIECLAHMIESKKHRNMLE